MTLRAQPSAAPHALFFNWSGIGRLALVVLLEAMAICIALLGPWSSAGIANLIQPDDLPITLLLIALLFGILLAPGWSDQTDSRRKALGRALYWGIWNGAVLGFFLLIASRTKLLESGAVVRCQLVVAGTLMVACLLATRLPRMYAGLLFLWCAGLPLVCYMLAEVFLSTPRAGGAWSMASEGPGKTLHALVNGVLASSPGTAAAGALNVGLVDGAAFGWHETGSFLLLIVLLLALLLGTWPTKSPSQPEMGGS